MGLPIDILLVNLFGLFAVLGVGFLAVRLKVVPPSVTAPLSEILMQISLPAMVFTSMIRPFDSSFLTSSLLMCGIGAAGYLVSSALAVPLSKFFRVPKERAGVWQAGAVYSNCGFMGFPIILAVLGEYGLVLAVMFVLIHNLIMFPLGAKQVSSGLPPRDDVPPVTLRSILLTAINVAMLLGLVFFFLQIPVPEAIMMPLDLLGGLTTPLSMLIIGMNIAKADFSEVFRDRDAYSATFLRLILFPVLIWAALKLLPASCDPIVSQTLVLIFAMPATAMCGALAEKYGADAMLGSRITFLTSLFCLITIPLICLLP